MRGQTTKVKTASAWLSVLVMAFVPLACREESGGNAQAVPEQPSATEKHSGPDEALLCTLDTGGPSAYSLAFSPDGKVLATPGGEEVPRRMPSLNNIIVSWTNPMVILWDVSSGEKRRILRHDKSRVISIKFAPDGKTLVSSDHDSVKVWDLESGLERFKRSGGTKPLAIHPSGRFVASAGLDKKTVSFWSMSSGEDLGLLSGHTGSIESVAFSPDGKTLAIADQDKTVRLWDVATRKERMTLVGHEDAVLWVAFSPDGSLVVSSSTDETVRLWDAAAGTPRFVLRGHRSPVGCVAFSPDGSLLASGSTDNSVALWDVGTGKMRMRFRAHGTFVYSVAFSPDGKLLASGDYNGTVRLWDVAEQVHRD